LLVLIDGRIDFNAQPSLIPGYRCDIKYNEFNTILDVSWDLLGAI
jgi:hypothetical protein